MTAIKIKKFYKKTGRRPRVDGKMHVAFDKRKVECFNCHNTGHFARECKFKVQKMEAGRKQVEVKNFKPRYNDIPLYSRFKQVEYKGVPHPLSGDYTPREQEDIDDSLYVYGKYGPQPQSPSPTVSNVSSISFSICPSNDNDGELGTVSGASSTHYSTCQSNDSDGEPGTRRCKEAALKNQRVIHANVRQASPSWTNINIVNKANQFTHRPVNIRPNLSMHVNTGRVNVNTGHGNVSSSSVYVNSVTKIKSGASRFNTGKQHVNSGSMHVNSGTQIKSGSSRFNTGKQNVNSGSIHVNTAKVNRPVSNNTSPKHSQVPKDELALSKRLQIDHGHTPYWWQELTTFRVNANCLGDDASKQGRIDIGDINTDAKIT
ncbi:ribonuclease H-like domain-containing protein [Tanacetum coccineum]